jgi:AAA family ATP:ADP antiporter
LYSKLSNILTKQQLFYANIAPFAIYFAVFAFILYPASDVIHFPTLSITGIEGFDAMFRIWSFSLFYTLAELWGSVVLALMFWGFANDTTPVEESKRFYMLFGLGANVALEFAGRASSYYNNISNIVIPAGVDPYQITLYNLLGYVVISAIAIMAIYWWINRYVLTDIRFFDPSKIKGKKSKPKMTLKESFKFLLQSKYLLYIAILVIAYGISINLIEVTWKEQLKVYAANIAAETGIDQKQAFNNFYGNYFRILGWTTVFMMLFVSGNVLRRFGWSVAAKFTPVVLMISSALFFTLLIFSDWFEPVLVDLGTTTLVAAVMVGTFQNVISKASKYSLFDPTKEMAYIPLDADEKVKGKAAIDVVGSRLGKGGGSVIQMFIQTTPKIASVVILILLGWIFAAGKLGKAFAKKTKEQEEEATPAV